MSFQNLQGCLNRKQSEDIIKVVNSAISLQESGFPEILFKRNIVEGPIMFELDATMISKFLSIS